MEYIILFFVFLFGASVGSFLNVVIDRLIQEKSLVGRSHCDFCHHKLAWYDLMPILSFFLLKGKCRYCHKKISWQYPTVELITGIIYLIVFKISNIKYQILNIYDLQIFLSLDFFKLLVLWGIFSCLIVIFVSDVKYHLISDWILWALFGFVLLFQLTSFNQFQQILTNFIPSGFIVSLPIFLIYFISHERAMGFGDVILSAIIGFFLGWQKGLLALYIAFISGGVVGFFLILLRRKKLKSKIAFGPFLVLGMVIGFFWGEKILGWIKWIYGF